MPDNKQSGPIKLPLSPQDALRALLLQVKPPEKPEKGSKGKKNPKPKGKR